MLTSYSEHYTPKIRIVPCVRTPATWRLDRFTLEITENKLLAAVAAAAAAVDVDLVG